MRTSRPARVHAAPCRGGGSNDGSSSPLDEGGVGLDAGLGILQRVRDLDQLGIARGPVREDPGAERVVILRSRNGTNSHCTACCNDEHAWQPGEGRTGMPPSRGKKGGERKRGNKRRQRGRFATGGHVAQSAHEGKRSRAGSGRATAYRVPVQRLGVLFDRVGIDRGLKVGVATGLNKKGPSTRQ